MKIENVYLCKGDLSNLHLEWIAQEGHYIALDTETTGLNATKDNLSIVQICAGKRIFIVIIDENVKPTNLISLLEDNQYIKVFHHAPFDLSFLMHHLGTDKINNVVCTKIAFKILHGTNTKSSLKDLTQKFLDVTLDKSQQLSDWSKDQLTKEQINYAVNDVKYLVELWNRLELNLKEERLLDVALKCFEFLPTQAFLSNKGIENIFKY